MVAASAVPEASSTATQASIERAQNSWPSGLLAAATGSSATLAVEIEPERQQGTVPTGTDVQRTGGAAGQRQGHRVIEAQQRLLALGRQPQVDDAGRAAEGDHQMIGFVAGEDLPGRVALQRERAALTRRSPLIGSIHRLIRSGSVSASQTSASSAS